MEIIEYSPKYDEQVKDLLVQLQEYIVSIDKDNLSILSSDYREKYFQYTKQQTYSQNGKIFLAEVDGKIAGLIAGHIRSYYDIDRCDYRCPPMGIIEELIVDKECRSSGIGKKLLARMEKYFKDKQCEYTMIGVFGYNQKAYEFYKKQNYNNRMITMLKKLD